MANVPQIKDIAARKNDARGKTLQLRLDAFDAMEGPVKISAWTMPVGEGDFGALVFEGWVHSDTFSISLSGKHEFPISVGGKRYPQNIGSSPKNKETGKPLDELDPFTWDQEAFIRGSVVCAKRGFCIHEERTNGKYRCPKAVILTGGRVTHAREPWVLREDGPIVPESQLAAARVAEKIKDAEITARSSAERAKREHLPPTAYRHAEPAPLNVPMVMGGSGPAA